MELTVTDFADGIRKIDLKGRFDIDAAEAIDLKFTVLTSSDRTLSIIDMSGVDFLASIGLATIVRNAKAAQMRKGSLVLLNPQANVARVLAASRIDQVIPVCYSLAEARTRLGSASTLP